MPTTTETPVKAPTESPVRNPSHRSIPDPDKHYSPERLCPDQRKEGGWRGSP